MKALDFWAKPTISYTQQLEIITNIFAILKRKRPTTLLKQEFQDVISLARRKLASILRDSQLDIRTGKENLEIVLHKLWIN